MSAAFIGAALYVFTRPRLRSGEVTRQRMPGDHSGSLPTHVEVHYSDADVARHAQGLSAGSIEARTAAAKALAAMGPGAVEAVPALVEAMTRRWAGVKFETAVAKALKAIGPAALPALVETLKSPSPKTRFAAAQAIAKLGPKASGAVQPLIAVLKGDPDLGVRSSAAHALGCIGAAASPAIPALKKAVGNINQRFDGDSARSELRALAQMALNQIRMGD